MSWKEELERQGSLPKKPLRLGSDSGGDRGNSNEWTEVAGKNTRSRNGSQKAGGGGGGTGPRSLGNVRKGNGSGKGASSGAAAGRGKSNGSFSPRKQDGTQGGFARQNSSRSIDPRSPRSPRPIERQNSSKSFGRQQSGNHLSRQQSGGLSRQGSRSFEPQSPRNGGRGRGHKSKSSANLSETEIARKLFTAEAATPPEEPIWRYIDENDNLQGPFMPKQMSEWYKGGYLALELPVCGMERRVSPPNLPDKGLYEPLGNLIQRVWRGAKFEPVNLDVILDRKAKIASGIQVVSLFSTTVPAELEKEASTKPLDPGNSTNGDGAHEPPVNGSHSTPTDAGQTTPVDRTSPEPVGGECISSVPSTPRARNGGTNGSAEASCKLVSAYSWADEMDGLVHREECIGASELQQQLSNLSTHNEVGEGNGCHNGNGSSAADSDDMAETFILAELLFNGAVWGMGQHDKPCWWYFDDNSKAQGPFASEDMLQWFRDGYLAYDLKMCGASAEIVAPLQPRKNFYRPLTELLHCVKTGATFPLYSKSDVKGKKK